MKILCIGDSNTYGYDPRSYFGDRYPEDVRWTDNLVDCEVVNRGVNGKKIPGSVARYLGMVRMEEPELVTVMLGTNDILSGIEAEEVARRMKHFISGIKEAGCPILLIAPPKLEFGEWVQDEDYLEESCELAGLYREIADEEACMFADSSEWDIELCYDGVHFSEEGHRKFSKKLNELLLNI